jgi:predicted alpha/beta-hydrolase family hydrolase
VPDLLIDGPAEAKLTLILAHGAGQPMDSPFMAFFATGLARAGLRVVRFEFPYMAARRSDRGKRPPDPQPRLIARWRDVIGQVGRRPFAIGGKSLGGRMASLIADEVGAAALVCLGFPFHPPGKPAGARLPPLATLATPTLILQGTRDPFGNAAEVAGYGLSPAITLHWLADGDHDFRPPAGTGRTAEANWRDGLAAILSFLSRTGLARTGANA